MTTESNKSHLDAQEHRGAKRAWSTPLVIEAELSDTNLPNPQQFSPVDKFTTGLRVGPS